MFTRSHSSARRLLALTAALLAAILGSLLSATPVIAQVPPPELVSPAAGNPVASGDSAWLAYTLIACVALLVGVALGIAFTRFSGHRSSSLGSHETIGEPSLANA